MIWRFRLLAAALLAAAGPASAQLTSFIDSTTRKVGAVETNRPLPVDTVQRSASVDRGALVGTTAVTLMPANAARRGVAVQNQSASATCYLSGLAAATADWHSLQLPPGALYETPPTHTGTGALSIVCTAAATPVYAREF